MRALPLPLSGAGLAIAITMVTAACTPSSSPSSPPPNAIVIQAGNSTGVGPSKAMTLGLGDTARIQYVLTDIFGRPLGIRPTFYSRDTRIASVSTTGLIRARGGGSTYIAALATTVAPEYIGDSIRLTVNVVCTLEARAGLVIAVEDSLTGSKGPFTNVSYVARDTSAYRDSTRIASVPAQVGGQPFLVGLAYERPGRYEVTVVANGYRAWVKPGVDVTKDACHVIAVNLTARLAPP